MTFPSFGSLPLWSGRFYIPAIVDSTHWLSHCDRWHWRRFSHTDWRKRGALERGEEKASAWSKFTASSWRTPYTVCHCHHTGCILNQEIKSCLPEQHRQYRVLMLLQTNWRVHKCADTVFWWIWNICMVALKNTLGISAVNLTLKLRQIHRLIIPILII